MRKILVTGATGKVGSHFIRRVLQSHAHDDVTIRALCHNRLPQPHDRLEIVIGSISDREVVRAAMSGITHVIHCATCKEVPETVMDVTVKGLFWLLGGMPRQYLISANHSDRRGRSARPFLLSPRASRYRTTEAQRLSRMLCPLQGFGRGDARAVLRSI